MINCQDQGLDDRGAVRVADALVGSPGVTALDVSHNAIGHEGAQAIGDALARAKVVVLSFHDNRLGRAGARALAASVGAKAGAHLRSLDLSLNELDAEGGRHLAPLLSAAASSGALTALDLSVNPLGDEVAAELCRLLLPATGLRHLRLRSCALGDAAAAAVADLLALPASALVEVVLADNQVADAGAEALAAGLRRNVELDILDLEGCQVGEAGVGAFRDLLLAWPLRSFSLLALGGNAAGDAGAVAALDRLLQTNRLRSFVAASGEQDELDASGPEAEALLGSLMGDWHVRTLAALVRDAGASYTALDVSRNRLGAAGAATLGLWLCLDERLLTLCVARNQVGDQGAVALARALRENVTLTSLDVGHNEMTDAGLHAIAKALHENEQTGISHLRVDGNEASTRAEQAIRAAQNVNKLRERLQAQAADAVQDLHAANLHPLSVPILTHYLCMNDACETLDLSRNHLGNEGAALLARDYLSRTERLVSLDLGGNEVSDEGAEAIAEALEENASITALVLSGGARDYRKRIGDRGAAALARALRRNSTLTALDLNTNSIKTRGCEALAKLITHTRGLLRLSVADNGLPIEGKQALKRAASGVTVLKKLALT